ncbi:alpha/beta fold hydrolase [Jatrophihabitans telluris]|uniref:Alpha/beta fold hydrolase n=1 Tax=Jatrophihabitans telluris TaxID=2038343 RepID=A0ABY4QVG9_9ACTN|nr:alpha/beta fold hydrolase [Jatrophihabitans telluris]UQX87663.1 alpha/beta fold hydrolase [Jatrophihabitans telluris]
MSDAVVRQEFVQLADVRLNVASAGPEDGPGVVLLHGFPDSHALWSAQIPVLAEAGFRVIAPDLRGFGASDRPTDVESYRMSSLVADVADVATHFGLPEFALVGHDWGAGLAWQTTFRHPGRVNRLAVFSVGHGGASVAAGMQQKQWSWYMLWFLFPGVAESVLPAEDWAFFRSWAWAQAPDHPYCAEQIADLSRPGALTAALNWYRANISPPRYVATAPLTGPIVRCPTMGVHSRQDPFLTEAQLSGSAEFVDAPWRFESVDCGHWIPVEAPERTTELLLDFLQ